MLMMNPTRRPMRRKDRAMPKEQAMALLENATHGTLSCVAEDGWPYATPLSHVMMDGHIYFHCAKEGLRSDALQERPQVCFSVVGGDAPEFTEQSVSFTTRFSSVLAFGRAYPVTDAEEKARALRALCEKTVPQAANRIAEALARSAAITAVWRVEIEHVSGKTNQKPGE